MAAPVDSALATFPLDSPMEAKNMKSSSLPRASPDAARGRAVAGKSVAKPTDAMGDKGSRVGILDSGFRV
jgi:hypothetical protein